MSMILKFKYIKWKSITNLMSLFHPRVNFSDQACPHTERNVKVTKPINYKERKK